MLFLLRALDKLAQVVLYTFAVLVITLAVMTSLLRYYLPQIDLYRTDLLTFVSEKTQWQINAESITAQWRQFKPSVELHHLRLSHAETGHRINLDYLQLELNIAKSLYHQRVYLEAITLDGLEVVLLQNEQGQWGVSSNSQANRTLAIDEIADYIWSIGSFRLQDLSLTMLPYQQQAIHFPQVSASLNSRLRNKILQIDIQEEQESLSHLVIETANHFKDEEFQAKIYWQTQNFPLHLFFPLIKDVTVHQESRISQQVWLNWQDGLPSGVGEFTLDGLAIDYRGKPWVAESGQGSFYLDADKHLLSLGIPSLSFTLNEQHIRFDNLKYEQQNEHKELQIEHVDLAEIDRYLRLITLPEKLQQLREDLQPSGELNHISLELKEQDILFKGNLHEVSVGAWAGAPALENVSGYVEASLFAGFVELDTARFSMAFPKLYDGKMQFRQSTGTVYWRVGKRIQVGSVGQIALDGLYGQAIGEFELEIPIGADPEDAANVGRMSLVVDLQDADARFRNDLIPSTLNEGLLDWLDESILGGQVKHGSFIYHGPIAAHGEEEKVIQLWLDVDNAAIRFHPEFPIVEDIAGEFLLDQWVAEAEINTAKSLDMRLKNAKLDLSAGGESPFLQISTELHESSQRVMAYLQQDFIMQASAGVLEKWQTSRGDVSAKVNVLVPLNAAKKTHVNVQATLNKVDLDIVQPSLLFEDISGGMEYDSSKGFFSNKLEGKLWDRQVNAEIRAKQSGSQLLFNYPQASVENLKSWLKLPLLEFFSGETEVRGELSWGDGEAVLNLASQLEGVRIDLPAPFSKSEQERKRLDLILPLGAHKQDLTLNIDTLHQVQLRLADGELLAGNMLLNNMEQKEFELGVFNIYGRLESANIAHWINNIEQYIDFNAANATSQNTTKLAIKQLELATVDLWSFPLDNVRLSAREGNQNWQVQFATDYVDGQLAIPLDEKPMQLEFDKLDLAFLQNLSQSEDTNEQKRKEVNFKPIQIRVEQLKHGEQLFGQWQLTAEAEHDLVLFNHIEARVREMHLGAISSDLPCQLTWSLTGFGQTKVSCRLESEKIDQSLKEWGLERGVFAEEFEAVIHDATWQGGPANFTMLTSRVPLSLSLKKGYFADVDSASTDALKALGFFNLSNLVRRLKLDFKDLSQEGLTFDRVKGQLVLDQGIVSTETPLLIKSSASEIKISGLGDFNREILDLDMSVSLPLVSNLPWIVALAAGLPAAVGVFVVSKIMGKQVDKLSTAVYRVSGSMEEPKVKFRRLFDVEKEKKKSK